MVLAGNASGKLCLLGTCMGNGNRHAATIMTRAMPDRYGNIANAVDRKLDKNIGESTWEKALANLDEMKLMIDFILAAAKIKSIGLEERLEYIPSKNFTCGGLTKHKIFLPWSNPQDSV